MLTGLYDNYEKLHLAVDCVIFGYHKEELKVLLCHRAFEPYIGQWSLLGGFVGAYETLGGAARRVLYETTGLTDIYQEQVHSFSKLDRDPGGRVISVVYYSLIRVNEEDSRLINKHNASWCAVSRLPKLLFDHREMIDQALLKLQQKASIEIVGKELLGDMFTLTNLRKLYEAIFQIEIDAGNFRKKLLSLDVLYNTGIKDKSESKKGAYLYSYDSAVRHQIETIVRFQK